MRDSPFFLFINLCNFLYIPIIVWVFGFSFVIGLTKKLYKILHTLSLGFFQNAGGTPTSIFEEIYSYAQTLENAWLFPSRKGDQPISKIQAYRQLQKAANFTSVESIGTHTMRKTLGFCFYKQTKDMAMLQEILNHSTPQITLKYIRINKEEKDNVLDNFHI
ncbi:hypothetical protein B5P40_08875 [Bacillus sp. SRB_8]|nr:hypothetical protein B5P40_08875 [Bacillus sp. SRB_8]